VSNEAWPGAPGESGWSRLTAAQKASVLSAGFLIVVLGLLTLIGATGHFPGHQPGSTPSSPPPGRPQATAVPENAHVPQA
jgi:hypothetical protein